jgi:hypothetical protein
MHLKILAAYPSFLMALARPPLFPRRCDWCALAALWLCQDGMMACGRVLNLASAECMLNAMQILGSIIQAGFDLAGQQMRRMMLVLSHSKLDCDISAQAFVKLSLRSQWPIVVKGSLQRKVSIGASRCDVVSVT